MNKPEELPSSTLTPIEAHTILQQEAQELFEVFVKDKGLILHIYAVGPKSGTPVPVSDYLPVGWDSLFIRATKTND